MKFRTITLKKEGTCGRCGGFIAVGERARWARGAGVWHRTADCPQYQTTADHAVAAAAPQTALELGGAR